MAVRTAAGAQDVELGKQSTHAKREKSVANSDDDLKVEVGPSSARIIFLVSGHALAASSLVVVNKWALKGFPFLWTLTTLQFAFAATLVWCCGKLGIVQVNAFDWEKFIAFFPAAGMFFITITAGNAVVQISNVDTYIVMRSVVPIPCALLEAWALNEPYPPPRSWGGLGLILLGAFAFAAVNKGLFLKSFSWVVLYMVMMPVDAVLIKHLIGSTGFTPWGMVFYNNLCAAMPGVVFALLVELRSRENIDHVMGSARIWSNLIPILLTCFMGICVSFFQLNVRKAISSTAFMVLGVSNKLLTVLLNQLAMDANSELASIGSVLISIFGAVTFQQTVKGKGLSQAPALKLSSDQGRNQQKAFFAMTLALCWCGYVTLQQQMSET